MLPWAPAQRVRKRPTLAALFSYAALSIFIVLFLFLGLFNHIESPYLRKKPKPSE